MEDQLSALYSAFKGKLIGKRKMKHHVVEVLLKMPKNIQAFVSENVWFVTSFEDAWAFTFTGTDFQGKHVVFLSDELLEQDLEQIYWTVAHEIGHVVLGHKNRFFEKFGKDKIELQEQQADRFASQFVEEPYK